jgi:hypothetical protein
VVERKPSGVPVEHWVERQIREAQERGEFDGLRGAGEPIPDLHQPRDELWWVKRKLRDEDIVGAPPSIAVKREVERTREAMARTHREERVRELVAAVNERIREVNATATAGPSTSVVPLDVDREVERWRADRTARGLPAR